MPPLPFYGRVVPTSPISKLQTLKLLLLLNLKRSYFFFYEGTPRILSLTILMCSSSHLGHLPFSGSTVPRLFNCDFVIEKFKTRPPPPPPPPTPPFPVFRVFLISATMLATPSRVLHRHSILLPLTPTQASSLRLC